MFVDLRCILSQLVVWGQHVWCYHGIESRFDDFAGLFSDHASSLDDIHVP